MNTQEKHLEYLFRSLQHHPSPYVIYDLDGSIRWANIAAKFIFRVKKLTDLSLKLEGLNRNVATHAAGVVIADKK